MLEERPDLTLQSGPGQRHQAARPGDAARHPAQALHRGRRGHADSHRSPAPTRRPHPQQRSRSGGLPGPGVRRSARSCIRRSQPSSSREVLRDYVNPEPDHDQSRTHPLRGLGRLWSTTRGPVQSSEDTFGRSSTSGRHVSAPPVHGAFVGRSWRTVRRTLTTPPLSMPARRSPHA